MGGQPRLREGFTTDNGNLILDCHGLELLDPPKMEGELNQIAGVVTNGIFARRLGGCAPPRRGFGREDVSKES